MPPEMVRLTNRDERVFSDRYAGTTYQVRKGDSVLVPWAAVKLWFGDPYVTDKPTMSRFDRQDEIERLYCRLGAYDGDGTSRGEKFFLQRPAIEVESLEGEKIVMLMDNIDGTDTPNAPSEKVDERVALASELERMKQIQSELLSRLQTLEAGQDVFDDLPMDTPSKVPVDEEG